LHGYSLERNKYDPSIGLGCTRLNKANASEKTGSIFMSAVVNEDDFEELLDLAKENAPAHEYICWSPSSIEINGQ
jgi:hypothetical protein